MADNYYKILGVDKSASDEDIKRAYRRLAHKHHPDKGGDEAMFKKVNEAYQVLGDKEKRTQYDRFGRVFDGAQGGGPFRGGPSSGWNWGNFGDGFEFDFSAGGGPASGWDFGNMEDLGGMSDVFDAFFEGLGVKRKRKAYRRGADLELAEEITIEEAFRGTVKQVRYYTLAVCLACVGLGHFPKDGFTNCAQCDGRGEIQETRQTFFGNFAQVKQCAKCLGAGKIPNKICSECSGTGRKKGEKTIELTVAPGVENGQLVKISGAGEVGERGAEAGDLYVRIRIKPHQTFTREGDDLLVQVAGNLIELLLHRNVQAPTISGGKIKIDIPAGFRFGDELVVPGEGMPRLGSYGRGNLRVILEIKMPKRISEKAKKLLEELTGEGFEKAG